MPDNKPDYSWPGQEKRSLIGKRLSRLSDKQLSDAFRAANYTPEEIRLLDEAVRARIKELAVLPR